MRLLHLIALAVLLFLFACEQPEQNLQPQQIEKPTTSNSGLFHQPIEPIMLELPSEALAHWRIETAEKPALVLFSFDPLLKSPDPALQQQARELAQHGSAEQLRRHGSFNSAEPVILPIQTVSAALDAGLFSKLYWVFPSKVDAANLELEFFREQMLEKELMTAKEAAALTLEDGIYRGTLRGFPFAAIHHQKLSEIPEPLVLHIEMGFFRGLYDNEIKSPLYTLLRDTALNIWQQGWQPLATTLSYSTAEGAISLDVRFVLSNFAELLRNPSLLDAEMPTEWQIRSEALYAGDMYSEAKKIELAKQIVQQAPESAAAHFDHFRALFLSKQLQPSLDALAEAVKRDPGYAASYLELAQMALQDGNIEMGMALLSRAEEQFPENPFIRLQKAYLLTTTGQIDEAEQLLAKLPQQWSPVYHQDIPGKIAEIRQLIETGRGSSSGEE